MKVGELINVLRTCNQDAEVIVSRDSEGNCFRHLDVVEDDNTVFAEDSYNIDVGFGKLTEKLKEDGYSEEDIIEMGNECVVIYPE